MWHTGIWMFGAVRRRRRSAGTSPSSRATPSRRRPCSPTRSPSPRRREHAGGGARSSPSSSPSPTTMVEMRLDAGWELPPIVGRGRARRVPRRRARPANRQAVFDSLDERRAAAGRRRERQQEMQDVVNEELTEVAAGRKTVEPTRAAADGRRRSTPSSADPPGGARSPGRRRGTRRRRAPSAPCTPRQEPSRHARDHRRAAPPTPPALADLARHSHALITVAPGRRRAPTPRRRPSPPTAGYAWLRDGAFTAEGISRYGDVASADRFHDWVARRPRGAAPTTSRRSPRPRPTGRDVPVERMLPDPLHLRRRRTAPTRGGTSRPTATALWLWSVVDARPAARPRPSTAGARGIARRDRLPRRPSGTGPATTGGRSTSSSAHVSTLGAIHAGLVAPARGPTRGPGRRRPPRAVAAAVRDLVRRRARRRARRRPTSRTSPSGSGSTRSTARSLACVVPFGLVDAGLGPRARRRSTRSRRDLDVDGGVHRFRADVFYGGGQWPLLSCLLGWNLRGRGRPRRRAARTCCWVADHGRCRTATCPSRSPTTCCTPSAAHEWVDRWGPVATPLLWSHGMFLHPRRRARPASRKTRR